MATIKVFDVNGVKELKCFDTLDNVAYMTPEESGLVFYTDEEEEDE